MRQPTTHLGQGAFLHHNPQPKGCRQSAKLRLGRRSWALALGVVNRAETRLRKERSSTSTARKAILLERY